MTAGTILDPRDAEIERLRTALAEANAALKRDADGRRRSKEAQRVGDLSARSVIDGIPGLVASLAPDGSVEFVNRQITAYCGATLEELRKWSLIGIVYEDDLRRVVALFSEAIAAGTPYEHQLRLRRFDGAYRWFSNRGVPVRDEAGNVLRWYVLLTDIEDSKRAEQALAESESRLQQTIDTIPAIVFCNSADGPNEYLSKGWHDYTGIPAEASTGSGWQASLHPDDLPQMMVAWMAMLKGGQGGEIEGRMRRYDGIYRWFLFSTAPLRDEGGKIVKWYGTVTDIEDRKQAEAELQRAYRDLSDAQRLSRTGSFTNDYLAGEHIWSDELYRMFEFELGSTVISEACLARIHPDDRDFFTATFDEAARTGKDIDASYRIVLPSGDVRNFHAIAHVTGWEEEHPIVIGAVQDVTDTKRAEAALDLARSELTYAARVMSLGVLTASIAHEVNQPLSGIITNANTCQRMLSADPPNLEGARETLRRTIRDGYRASEVIARLRTLFSKKDFAAEAVDLNEATREVVAMTNDELRRRRVVVRVDCEEGLPQLTGDRVQLQQVVLNLLLNASDALKEVHERPREISVRTLREAGAVCVSVRDSGPGLGPDVHKRIFEPFFTTKQTGMGIGLSVSRSIIERHNGRLWATPNDGPGVTFSFSIPFTASGGS